MLVADVPVLSSGSAFALERNAAGSTSPSSASITSVAAGAYSGRLSLPQRSSMRQAGQPSSRPHGQSVIRSRARRATASYSLVDAPGKAQAALDRVVDEPAARVGPIGETIGREPPISSVYGQLECATAIIACSMAWMPPR